jgi:hypothetical protein
MVAEPVGYGACVPQASTARISLPDRYRVVRHLANGGMASVWEAHDELLARSVAVKVLATHLGEDDNARLRFEREARAAAGLSSHPNVVTIYDVGEHDNRAFMVMELMRGGSVADRLRAGRERSGDEREARGGISRDTVRRWLHEAAAGLDAAHDGNIVHRDIKPANLLLDERDRLAIADFGIARVAQEDQLTQTGQVLGTASYISPEQAVGEPAVAASDRYSLAVVAYELLTGSRPFPGEHFAAQARAHVEDTPEPPSARNPDLSAAVDAVLMRGLDKEPERRWPSASEMVARLEDALDVPAPERVATEPTRRLEPIPAPRRIPPPPPAAGGTVAAGEPHRRLGGLALLGGLAGLLLFAVLAYALLTGGGDNTQTADTPRATATATATATAETAKATATPTPTATKTASPTPTATATPTPAQPPAPTGGVDLNRARDLQLKGYNARQAGDYAQAIAFSQQALEACGDKGPLSPCGFAAYELGYSLNHTGRSAEAIPYLERRVAYGDGNKEAEKELKDARKRAGG